MRAETQGIIVFAAASGGTGSRVGFPAFMPEVIAVNSADAYGNASEFNPLPRLHDSNFTLLGEDVESAWPVALGEGPVKRASGLSVATAIATGIAALVVEFVNQQYERFEPSARRIQLDQESMRLIFRYLSSGRADFGNVTLWKLLKPSQDNGRILRTIESIVQEAQYKRMHRERKTAESNQRTTTKYISAKQV